jgi:ribose 5-phosphate isomerase B
MAEESHKTIAIGADHAGYLFKTSIIHWLKRNGYEVLDYGTDSEAATDYPDHVHPVAEAVEDGRAYLGIVICGSGNGTAITANKHQGIRAALCWNNELASLARQHNDANVISIPRDLFLKQWLYPWCRLSWKRRLKAEDISAV